MTDRENMTEHLLLIRETLLGGSDLWRFTEKQQHSIQHSVAQLVRAYEMLAKTVLWSGGEPEAPAVAEPGNITMEGDWPPTAD